MIATEADLPRIVEMGRAFHSYSPWSDYAFDEAGCADYARGIMQAGVIILSDTGMIGGLVHKVPFVGLTVAAELFWWGDGSLKIRFEDWARVQGAQAIQFSALVDDKSQAMARVFRRGGYRPVETGYLKDL